MQTPEAPQELLDLCAKLHEQCSTLSVSPYLLDDEEWRLKVEIPLAGGKKFVVGYLAPNAADWHTYYIFVHNLQEAYVTGLKHGRQYAAEDVCAVINKLVVR